MVKDHLYCVFIQRLFSPYKNDWVGDTWVMGLLLLSQFAVSVHSIVPSVLDASDTVADKVMELTF